MIALRREIFLLNYTKADRLNTVRNKRTQIIQQERTNFQSYEEKMKQLNVIVPEILTKEHNRQNYKESMLIPIMKIFQDMNFANKEIFEVIDLYLQYEIQFIKSYTLIEMRDSPNYQDETTKQVLEYLSNLNYGQFEISDLINTEIIEQLAFIITNSQHPWIVEQAIYTLLQLLIMDDKQMIEKFKQLKIISPCIDNVLNLGYFHNKYFIELVSNLITEFSLLDEYQDYGDYFQVITFWNKILETEYDDYLFQIQLEASLFYSIYLLSRNYNDIQWEFIYDQEENQFFLEDAMTRISKLTFKDHDSDNLKHAINGYKAVYYGMINNMIQNLDAFEVLNFYSEKLISMLLMDLKSDSQEIIDLDCSILFGLMTCDVKLRLDILRSHIYNWFHIILDVNFNQTINKSQIINVLLEAINFDDQNYIMELMQQDIIKALVHSIEQHDLTSQQLSEILSAMIFISNIQNDYLNTLNSLNNIQWNQFIAYVLQDRRIIILIQDKIQDVQNKKELESILGQLVQLTNTFAQKRMKYNIK